MYLGIDLSLRSTGLVFIGNDIKYKLITPSPKVYNDEELILHISDEIIDYIKETKPTHIGLEGLSFGSLSGSKDILAGNFWFIRTMIYKLFPDIQLEIIPVLTWRSLLFNKEERKILKENTQKVKQLKKDLMKCDKEEKKKIVLENEELIRSTDIKYLTWMKIPEPYKSEFEMIGFKKGCYDLSDAMHIASHIKNKKDK